MGLILLEALLAGALFILIIWWTMFSGRKGGELHDDVPPDELSRRKGEPPET